jgi:hypothetical protein
VTTAGRALYPRKMAAESEQPTPPNASRAAPSSSSQAGTDATQVEPGAGQVERFGGLELLRTRKADGRALLLFSRREREPE